jgi:hypothetical protein
VKELEDKVAALESQLINAGTARDAASPQRSPSGCTDALKNGTDTTTRSQWPQDFMIPPESDCRILIDAYFEHSNFFSPFIDQSKVAMRFQRLHGKGIEVLSSNLEATFLVCSVLAVSVRLVHCTDPTCSTASAERFFAVALSAYEDQEATLRTGDLNELECLLLIVQYTMFASDLTTCLRYLQTAIGLVVSLNLHTHSASTDDITPRDRTDESARGQWLFWTTYNFERNLRSALQMPMTLPDSAIKRPLPPDCNNDHMQALAIHILRYRQLESAIQTYRSQSVQDEASLYDSITLRSQLFTRLLAWKEQCPPFFQPTKQVSLDIIEGLFEVAVVRLYSTSSRLASLSQDETITLLKHAAHGITMYRKSFKEGWLRFYWRTIHNLYSCGSALIHCVKASAASPDVIIDMGQAMYLATICSNVLWGMAERYPAGIRLRDTFDDLADNAFHAKSRELLTTRTPGPVNIEHSFESQTFEPHLGGTLYNLDTFDESLYCS